MKDIRQSLEKKPRRVRVCDCPYCGVSNAMPRDKKDGLHILQCWRCFWCADASKLPSRLEART